MRPYFVTINGLNEGDFDTLKRAEVWAKQASNSSDEVLVYQRRLSGRPNCIGDYSNAWKQLSSPTNAYAAPSGAAPTFSNRRPS